MNRASTVRTRFLSLLMALVLMLGMLPIAPRAAAHWADGYLSQLEEWGVIQENQTRYPDRALTRAEFMAIINRAYGYHEVGPIPFTDVSTKDWFFDDVSIAYTAKYIKGTSASTASPNATLTREMAACVLGRNMQLKELSGEVIDFTDGRDISNWSRGMIQAAIDNYLLNGYKDGSFRPGQAVTYGEMAALVTRCVGTPIQEEGTYSLGHMFSNVTITSPGVTLQDTTISGDLYITGGVGLGSVRLENVNVLGRIIVSGSGESEEGDMSAVLVNVTADEMLVDNLRNQYVTVRAEGNTIIRETSVRAPAYLQDNTPREMGLLHITLEGEPGTPLDLAGRIKSVTNKTPQSLLKIAKGSAQQVTMDEDAIGAQLQIDRGAEVREVDLDVATQVVGDGDIDKLHVNAPGSIVSMLPDEIEIRPGITANINGQEMDTNSAEEASQSPKLLTGYPAARDVAPTSLKAVFATNKRGTVYWAVSPITDGSVSAEDLISPPSYGNVAVAHGSVVSPTATTETVVPVTTGLVVGGAYYLSAIMVDGRGERSPLKVTAFVTPDNTKPDFAAKPTMSKITGHSAQVFFIPNKTCKLYYAVFPKGSKAPTENDFKTLSLTGNLGYGIMDVEKNTEYYVDVSDTLEELKEYDLYLWLNDADSANCSAIQKLTFKTIDETPPEFLMEPTQGQPQATSVSLNFTLNENGTVFWVAVKAGSTYPLPKPGTNNADVSLTDEYAKLQVANGMNGIKSGRVNATGDKEGTITVSGLTKETAYDLYYVAKDTAGNYSESVGKVTIHTLDENPPTVRRYFSKFAGSDNTTSPLPGTDIILEFSEDVRSSSDRSTGTALLELYRLKQQGDTEAGRKLADDLRNSIVLYQTAVGSLPKVVNERTDANENNANLNWAIDYRNATVTGKDGKILVTFPTVDESQPNAKGKSALNLASGATYYFEIYDVSDTSVRQNEITPNPVTPENYKEGDHFLPSFTTVFAQVYLSSPGVDSTQLPTYQGTGNDKARVDMSFRMSPRSTSKVEDGISYDLILWSTTELLAFDLYFRVLDDKGTLDPSETDAALKDINDKLPATEQDRTKDNNGWIYLGNSGLLRTSNNALTGVSVNGTFNKRTTTNFPILRSLKENKNYEFAISVTQKGTSTSFETWSGEVALQVYVAAGASNTLSSLSNTLASTKYWEEYLEAGLDHSGIVSIGNNTTTVGLDYIRIRYPFTDTSVPTFQNKAPTFAEGDTFVDVAVTLSRAGTIYYVVAPAGRVVEGGNPQSPNLNGQPTRGVVTQIAGTGTTPINVTWAMVPENGQDQLSPPNLIAPDRDDIFNPPYNSSTIVKGSKAYSGGQGSEEFSIPGLLPLTDYFIYFVLRGTSQELSTVYCYKFTTTDIAKPKITLDDAGGGLFGMQTQVPANMNYALFTITELLKVAWFDSNHKLKTYSDNQTSIVNLNDTASKYSYVGTAATTSTTIDDTGVKYDEMTLLQALLATFNHNRVTNGDDLAKYDGYSVFDLFANDATKRAVANVIRNTSSGQALYRNSKTTSANNRIEVNDTAQLKDNNGKTLHDYFYCFSVGYHTSSERETGDAFKALANLIIPDNDPPILEKVSLYLDDTSPNLTQYTGTLTLTFDKPLYWTDGTPGAKTIPVITGTETPGKNKNILKDLDGSAIARKKLAIPGAGTESPSASFTIEFGDTQTPSSRSGLSPSDNIILFNTGRIANATGPSTASKLTLTFVKDTSGGGNQSSLTITQYYIEFTWEGKTYKSNVITAGEKQTTKRVP